MLRWTSLVSWCQCRQVNQCSHLIWHEPLMSMHIFFIIQLSCSLWNHLKSRYIPESEHSRKQSIQKTSPLKSIFQRIWSEGSEICFCHSEGIFEHTFQQTLSRFVKLMKRTRIFPEHTQESLRKYQLMNMRNIQWSIFSFSEYSQLSMIKSSRVVQIGSSQFQKHHETLWSRSLILSTLIIEHFLEEIHRIFHEISSDILQAALIWLELLQTMNLTMIHVLMQ